MAVVKVVVEVDKKGSLQPTINELNAVDAAQKKVAGGMQGFGKLFDSFGSNLTKKFDGLTGGLSSTVQGLGAAEVAAGAAAGAFVAAGAALASVTMSFVEHSDHLDEMSSRYGIAVSELGALEKSLAPTGVALESFADTVSKLEKNLGSGSTAFQRLGLNAEELKKMLPVDAAKVVLDQIARIGTESGRTAALMETFGKSGLDAWQAYKQGAFDSLDASRAMEAELGDSREQAAKLADEVSKLSVQWTHFKDLVGAKVGLPILESITALIDKVQKFGFNPSALAYSGRDDLFGGEPALPKYTGVDVVDQATAAIYGSSSPQVKSNVLVFKTEQQVTEELRKQEASRKAGLALLKQQQEEAARLAKTLADILDQNAKAMYQHAQKETKSTYDYLEKSRGLGTGGLAGPIEDLLKGPKREQLNVKELAKETFDWQGALQGVALLAGTLGGKFGDVLQVVENIGQAFQNAKTTGEKWQAGLSSVGMIGGLVSQSGHEKTGGALSGAAGGAKMGMALGSIIPGIGTVVGGVVGAVAGGIMGWLKGKKALLVKEAQQAAKDIAEAISKGTEVSSFIPKLLKDKKTALATFDQLGQQFAQMQEQYQAAVLQATKDSVGGLTAMITYLGKKTGDTTADFQRMGTYVMGIFGSLRKQGLSFLDAVSQIKPALDEMRKQAEAKGTTLTGGAADLAHFSDLIDQNKELVAAAEGAGQVLEGLRVSGSLTQETFTGLQTDVKGYIQELTNAGFAPEQALAVAAPSLYQLKKAHEELGLTLDAETQAAIDAAEAQGLFDGMQDPLEAMKKAMDAMVEVMAAIAQSFGVTLPAAVAAYIAELNKIPPIPVPGAPGGTTTGTGATPGAPTGAPTGVPGHASGLDYVPRGPLAGGGSLNVLHPGEAVLNARDAEAWRSRKGGRPTTTVSVGNITVPPYMNEDQAQAFVAKAVVRAMRDNTGGVTSRTRRALATRG